MKYGGGRDVSHAVLCGVPNHGLFAWDENPGNECNGRGPFLRGLNEGESEVVPGTAFLTLRSDGLDKYAQADRRFVGKPGVATNVTTDGPALNGATNLVLWSARPPARLPIRAPSVRFSSSSPAASRSD